MDFSGDAARYDWPGVSFLLAYEGKVPLLDFADSDQEYNLEVDGAFRGRLTTTRNGGPYAVPGVPEGSHTLRVARRTEADHGISSLRGLVLPEGCRLLDAPPTLERRLEFVGDSLSAGYGNEGPGVDCESLRPWQNADLAFPALTARALGADAHVIAVSGRGMVRNYGDPKRASRDPLPYYYPRTLKSRPKPLWDPDRFRPHAVVVFLGNNDHSTEPRPKPGDFQAAYLEFLQRLRKRHPQAMFFCLARPGYEDFEESVRAVVEEADRSGIGPAHFFAFDAFQEGDWGCDYHPRVAEHRRMAAKLAPFLGKKLGWGEAL